MRANDGAGGGGGLFLKGSATAARQITFLSLSAKRRHGVDLW